MNMSSDTGTAELSMVWHWLLTSGQFCWDRKALKYLLPMSKPELCIRQLADFWKQCWLSMRIQSDEILNRLDDHRLTYPVIHGAKVSLPPQDELQLELWDDFT